MIVINFDVLANPHEQFTLRHPSAEGVNLWRMMFEQYMGRVTLVINGDENMEHVTHWLKMNGIKPAIIEILDSNDPHTKAEKIQLIMSTTGRLDWYIDIDPNMAQATMAMGIPTLLVALPFVVRPEWSGDKKVRDWDSIVAEIDKQAIMRADKTWETR